MPEEARFGDSASASRREEQTLEELQQDLARRQYAAPPPRRLGDVMAEQMSRHGYARMISNQELEHTWEELVGEDLARVSRPGRVTRGVLEILVHDSMVMHQLSFQKPRLLKALQRSLAPTALRDLRLRIGSVE